MVMPKFWVRRLRRCNAASGDYRWHAWQLVVGLICRAFLMPCPTSSAVFPPPGDHVRFVTSPNGRRCCDGSSWHFRHQPMLSGFSCDTTFISFTCPWQLTQLTPLLTWTAWL